jgi:hypothetical protein
MNGPILADTSVWINFFKGTHSKEVTILTTYIENDDPIYLCPTIVQEVLQGINNDMQFREIKKYLLAFNILNDDGLEMAISAAILSLPRSSRRGRFAGGLACLSCSRLRHGLSRSRRSC